MAEDHRDSCVGFGRRSVGFGRRSEETSSNGQGHDGISAARPRKSSDRRPGDRCDYPCGDSAPVWHRSCNAAMHHFQTIGRPARPTGPTEAGRTARIGASPALPARHKHDAGENIWLRGVGSAARLSWTDFHPSSVPRISARQWRPWPQSHGEQKNAYGVIFCAIFWHVSASVLHSTHAL